jgi:hypothetical protein
MTLPKMTADELDARVRGLVGDLERVIKAHTDSLPQHQATELAFLGLMCATSCTVIRQMRPAQWGADLPSPDHVALAVRRAPFASAAALALDLIGRERAGAM